MLVFLINANVEVSSVVLSFGVEPVHLAVGKRFSMYSRLSLNAHLCKTDT